MNGCALAAVLQVAPRADAHVSEMPAAVQYLLIAVVCLVVFVLAVHIGRAWRRLARAEREAKTESNHLKVQIEVLLPEVGRLVEEPAVRNADRDLFLEKQLRFAELCTQMDGGKRLLPWDTLRRELADIHFRFRMLRAPLTTREREPAETPPGS